MDIKTAIAEAERMLRKIKEQEEKPLRALEGHGKEVLQKARQGFRTTVSETEAELKVAAEIQVTNGRRAFSRMNLPFSACVFLLSQQLRPWRSAAAFVAGRLSVRNHEQTAFARSPEVMSM